MKTQLELGNQAAGPLPVNYTNPLPVISGGLAADQIFITMQALPIAQSLLHLQLLVVLSISPHLLEQPMFISI